MFESVYSSRSRYPFIAVSLVFLATSFSGCDNEHSRDTKMLGTEIVKLGLFTTPQLVWAPDGSAIAFERLQVTEEGQIKRPMNSTVEVWDLPTRQRRFRSDGPRTMVPVWSPDGTRLLFAEVTKARIALQSLNLTTGEVQGLGLPGGSITGRPDSTWLSGSDLIYVSKKRPKTATLRILNMETLSDSAFPFQSVSSVIYPVVSPDKSLIAVTERKPDSNRILVITQKGEIACASSDIKPEISNAVWLDRNTVIYLAISGKRGIIRKLTVTSGKEENLHEFDEPSSALSVHPSLKLFVFGHLDESGDPAVYFSDGDGHITAASPEGSWISNPSLSPDESMLAFLAWDSEAYTFSVRTIPFKEVKSTWKPRY